MVRKDEDEVEYDDPISEFLHKIRPLRILALVALVILGITMLTGIKVVDSTERAVVFHKTNGSLSILDPGYHYVAPVFNSATKYSVRQQVYTESAVGISLDLQETTTEVTVRYSPDPQSIQTIHQTLGTSYEKKILVPAVQSCVKAAISNYNVEQLTGSIRAVVSEKISDCIKLAAVNGHLLVETVSVTDFDFSDSFNHAIEAKAVAQQAAQEEKNRLEQVKYQANQTIIKAQAQAEAVRLLNDASLTENGHDNAYLFLEWLKVWDGKLPTVMSGEQGSNLLITPPSTNQP
jgi:regulator of protease activity HflC (stomatin/prohibitin superfamily)